MEAFLRWGNWAVAKLIMVLFDTGSPSDVGCTMRLVSGPGARRLLPYYTVKDNAFSPEMMLFSVVGGWRVVQVPVNFRTRGGPRPPAVHRAATVAVMKRVGLLSVAEVEVHRRVPPHLHTRRGARRDWNPDVACLGWIASKASLSVPGLGRRAQCRH